MSGYKSLPSGKGYGKNKQMNDKTYALRRKVMNIIYDFKKVVDMNRVNVRIIEENSGCQKHVVGVAQKNIIYIPASTINRGDLYLRNVVYHELGHAMFNLRHDENCKLMCSHMSTKLLTKNELNSIVKEWGQ